MDTIATTINGHSATTQKERFQSGFSGVGFLFMPLFTFEDRHFKSELLLTATRVKKSSTSEDVANLFFQSLSRNSRKALDSYSGYIKIRSQA